MTGGRGLISRWESIKGLHGGVGETADRKMHQAAKKIEDRAEDTLRERRKGMNIPC